MCKVMYTEISRLHDYCGAIFAMYTFYDLSKKVHLLQISRLLPARLFILSPQQFTGNPLAQHLATTLTFPHCVISVLLTTTILPTKAETTKEIPRGGFQSKREQICWPPACLWMWMAWCDINRMVPSLCTCKSNYVLDGTYIGVMPFKIVKVGN